MLGLSRSCAPARSSYSWRTSRRNWSGCAGGGTMTPMRAARRSVFNHQQSVWRAMERLDDPRIGRTQRRVLEGELREVLTVWWQTDAVRHVRPVVEDEVRRILFFFEAVLFDAAPRVEAGISRSFDRSWPPSAPP